ncbi:MAG: PIN domain-containing protein [Clostridiales bacterium]|jgi:tRNA(fMet)-specific endonuclease VapC|nr:PIN domain-containing protein [Clostridiales bacterium]
MDYAFDTNIIVHLLIGTEAVRINRDEARSAGARFIIPPFVQYEIERGLLIKPNDKYRQAYERLLENCEVGEMTAIAWKEAAQIYADLYNKRFTVKDSDIIIAAFCVANEYILVTNNTKDFINMDNVKLVDWVYRTI